MLYIVKLAAIGSVTAGVLFACSEKKFSDRTYGPRGRTVMPTGTEVSTTETRGGVKATLDPNSKDAQIINIKDGSLAGVSIGFPPGSLSIPLTVSVSPGSAVNGPSVMGNLGINNNSVTSSGVPVEISADKSVDLRNPMVLALPIPRGASLVGESVDRKRLAVLYRVKVAEGGDTGNFTGLVPASALGWVDGKVLFETRFFGWFAVVEMETPVTAAVQVKVRYADQMAARYYSALADLPACTSADIDRIAYVAAENVMYYCASAGKWVAIEKDVVEDEDDGAVVAQPIRLLKDDGSEVGRVLTASGAWRLIVEDSDGVARLIEIYVDYADPSVGILGSDIYGVARNGTRPGPDLFFTGSGCTGSAYYRYSPSVSWISKPLYADDSSPVGGWYDYISVTPTASINYVSYYDLGMADGSRCTDTSSTTITNTYLVQKLSASMPVPFTAAWSVE